MVCLFFVTVELFTFVFVSSDALLFHLLQRLFLVLDRVGVESVHLVERRSLLARHLPLARRHRAVDDTQRARSERRVN